MTLQTYELCLAAELAYRQIHDYQYETWDLEHDDHAEPSGDLRLSEPALVPVPRQQPSYLQPLICKCPHLPPHDSVMGKELALWGA